MDCVETKGLGHRYLNDEVLKHLDLRVPQGSIYGFLGPNGAGKTTTLRLLLGLLQVQQGTITILGKPFRKHRLEILGKVGSLIEGPSLYDHLTAQENLMVLQKVHRCPTGRIGEVLELVGLGSTASKKVRQFSLGMKQRLGLAAALLHRPSLLILDEPTNGLDPNGVLDMRQLLTRLNREEGVTILLSSHQLAEIEKLVTHLGILRRGKLVFQGTLAQLKAKQEDARWFRLNTQDNQAALALVSRQVPAATLQADSLRLPAMSHQQIAGLNRLLVSSGLDVHEIQPIRPDLESIFLDLVMETTP